MNFELSFSVWLMDRIICAKINTIAVKSREHKIEERSKDRKEIVLVELGPCREHLHLVHPAISTGTGRDTGKGNDGSTRRSSSGQ